MSSPGGLHGTAHWQASTAQNLSHEGYHEPEEEEGVIVKPMRLKVLYTFDDENKTNCLARWPNVLQIKTVQMDEGATIGVVELKTCIEAIVQCSPEIVAKLGQDYTVYAYDYSEYDHPQVGQGLLSRALAATSPTPDAPAYQSRQLITGRVCKNIQGLFANGVKETLEVKLRLVPVPTVLQHEFLSTMEKYRELSKAMPVGVDHNEWSTFLQSNPSIAQMATKINAPAAIPNKRDGVSMEVVNQLLSPSIAPENSMDPFNNNSGGDSRASTPAGCRKAAASVSRPSSRASVKRPRKSRTKSIVTGGNTSGYEEGTDGDDGPQAKKRAKIQKADWKSKSSFGSGSDSLRVTASTAGSIRLFRPIAVAPGSNPAPGSHLQEFPRAPTPVPNMSGQGGQRGRSESQSGLRRNSLASNYANPQQQQYNSPYNSLYENPGSSHDLARPSIESPMTSPEKDDSSGETPPDIASSPPVLRAATPMRSSPPIPSSPVLPQMPRTDSGFMSGDVSELFEDEDDGIRPIDDEDVAIAAKYTRRRPARQGTRGEVHHGFAIQEVTPGPVELLPTKMFPRVEPKQYMERLDPKYRPITPREDSTLSDDFQNFSRLQTQNSVFAPNYNMSQPSPTTEHSGSMPPPVASLESLHTTERGQDGIATSSNQRSVPITSAPSHAPSLPRPASRMMSRTASSGSLTLPNIAASDPVLPPSTLNRSHTWSEAPHPATDNDMSNFSARVPRGSTAGVLAKKNSIRSRLETAISKGESPPFCKNCGAIETPTWRKAWAKEIEGDPGFHEYSDEPGKVTAIDILTKDEAGKPTSYRLIKKSLLNSEDKTGFEQLLLCNPCGIWMSKYKSQRPSDKWQVDPKKPSEKRKRPPKAKQVIAPNYSNIPVPTSEAYYFPSDAPGPYMQSDAPGPTEYAPLASLTESFPQYQAPPAEQSSQQDISALPVQRHRAASLRPSKSSKAMASDTASAALRRAIQSSPARWLGSRQSPIELEEDLGSTRRLLFPSPHKDASPQILGEVVTNVMQPAVQFRSPTRSKDQLVEVADKENCPPSPLFGDMDDDIMKLFGEEISRPSCPTTPTQKTPQKNLFKTPTRPTPNHRPITRSVSRSAKSIRGSMMPQRTPSSGARRRSPRNHEAVFESPFTATLNKLISEANNNHHANQSPSRNLDLGIEFSLPDLGHSTTGMHSDAMTFQLPGFDPNHDFFSTDVPMPSSPPKMFDLYEDPIVSMMDSTMWSDFHMDENTMNSMSAGLSIDEHGRATFEIGIIASGNETQIKTDPGTPIVEREMQLGEEEILLE